MKKIALLFTLLCVSTLNGMENPEHDDYKGLGGLSPEIQVMIISYVYTYNNLEDIINAIKATMLVDKELNVIVNDMYNLGEFRSLIFELSKKISLTCTLKLFIAERLGTRTAKRYLQVFNGTSASRDMVEATLSPANITKLIYDGADVNFFNLEGKTPLLHALKTEMPLSSIQLLLEHGANPNVTDNKNKGVFEYLDLGYPQKFELYRIIKPKIKQLLEDAMKKTTLVSVDFL